MTDPEQPLLAPQRQIPLPVALKPEASFDELVDGPNAPAFDAVRSAVASHAEPFLYLFGASGTGKSHLLHAACHAARLADRPASYIGLGAPHLSPAMLEGLEQSSLVALDDIHRVAAQRNWERGILDLYNRLRETGRLLLVTADRPAQDLTLELPDLGSRLGWGPSYRLQTLGDADCEFLLRTAARRRGLALNEAEITYIMRHARRDARGLLALLDALDQASLRERRRPNLRLIRSVLDGADQATP